MAAFKNTTAPAPKWYRNANKIYGNTETFGLALLLVLGYGEDSKLLLIIKLTSSFIRGQLDIWLTSGEEYAPAGATEALVNVTQQTATEAIKENAPLATAAKESKQGDGK